MDGLWSFLGKKRNREVLGWAGGGLVVVLAGLWAVVTYIFPPSSATAGKPMNIDASCGGISVGGNITGSTVKTGNFSGDCAQKAR
jgi:hypothetical protein